MRYCVCDGSSFTGDVEERDHACESQMDLLQDHEVVLLAKLIHYLNCLGLPCLLQRSQGLAYLLEELLLNYNN